MTIARPSPAHPDPRQLIAARSRRERLALATASIALTVLFLLAVADLVSSLPY